MVLGSNVLSQDSAAQSHIHLPKPVAQSIEHLRGIRPRIGFFEPGSSGLSHVLSLGELALAWLVLIAIGLGSAADLSVRGARAIRRWHSRQSVG